MDFYNQEKELLKYYLFANLFNKDNVAEVLVQKGDEFNKEAYVTCTSRPAPNYLNIELIVRPECNQNCSYCYIAQHGKELYPIEERVDNNTICANLRSLLDYIYIKYRLFIGDFELFAGDMFYDGLYFDLLDIFYEYLSKEAEKYPTLYDKNDIQKMKIAAPVNMSFTLIPEYVEKFEKYYNKFQEIGVDLWLSASIDGVYVSDTRENRKLPDDYFDNIFKFCKKFGFFFHPMVGSVNIHNWKENYDWWLRKFDEFELNKDRGPDSYLPMMLEVRNDDWTDETIKELIDWYDYILQDRFRMNDYNLHKMARHFFVGDGDEGSLHGLGAYDPLKMVVDTDNEGALCTLQTVLNITLNNLSIVPCHRTTYKQFICGHFVLSNDSQRKIIDIEPDNVNGFMTIMEMRRANMPKCAHCQVQHFCPGGCLGAQYESSGEIFQPNISCCKMFRQKYAFLTYKIEKMGILEEGFKSGFVGPKMIDAIEAVKETEEYKEFVDKDEY